MVKMKKAIFGGSFDPPHVGHLEIIKQALTSLDVDELIVVPAFLNPFKSESFAPASLRHKWLKSMTKELKGVTVSSFEIDQKRAVASIETIKHFMDSQDTIYFIIGADNLQGLPKWKNFEELDEIVTWVVATRSGIKIPPKYLSLNVNKDISATELREQVNEAYLDKSIADEIITYYKNASLKS